eukprot:5291680-Amphidinium_carterae.1
MCVRRGPTKFFSHHHNVNASRYILAFESANPLKWLLSGIYPNTSYLQSVPSFVTCSFSWRQTGGSASVELFVDIEFGQMKPPCAVCAMGLLCATKPLDSRFFECSSLNVQLVIWQGTCESDRAKSLAAARYQSEWLLSIVNHLPFPAGSTFLAKEFQDNGIDNLCSFQKKGKITYNMHASRGVRFIKRTLLASFASAKEFHSTVSACFIKCHHFFNLIAFLHPLQSGPDMFVTIESISFVTCGLSDQESVDILSRINAESLRV